MSDNEDYTVKLREVEAEVEDLKKKSKKEETDNSTSSTSYYYPEESEIKKDLPRDERPYIPNSSFEVQLDSDPVPTIPSTLNMQELKRRSLTLRILCVVDFVRRDFFFFSMREHFLIFDFLVFFCVFSSI